MKQDKGIEMMEVGLFWMVSEAIFGEMPFE